MKLARQIVLQAVPGRAVDAVLQFSGQPVGLLSHRKGEILQKPDLDWRSEYIFSKELADI